VLEPRPKVIGRPGLRAIIDSVPVSPSAVPAAARAFLAGAIDYAGLFPPAELGMPAAVGNYLAYRSGSDAWALGRFVVPVARLGELEQSLPGPDPARGAPVSLSALLGGETAADLDTVEAFNRRAAEHGALIEALEVKAPTADAVREVLATIPRGWIQYVELPIAEENAPALDAIQASAGFAKLRTGGITADAFPAPEPLLHTLQALAGLKLPFKATAGLHHPLRGVFPLTEAPDAPVAAMYGYLNILLAALILWTDGDPGRALEALLEETPTSLCFEEDALVWRDSRFEVPIVATVRKSFFHGFGSCSFREPLDLLPLAGTR
jgi:hypothetical protein